MQDHAFTVFGERRSHNRYTNQTQRTIKSKWFNTECYEARKTFNQDIIDFFESEHKLTGTNSLLQKQNTTKLNEQLNANINR